MKRVALVLEQSVATKVDTEPREHYRALTRHQECTSASQDTTGIALGNLFDLDEVVLEALRHWTAYVPDHLWLVDTTDDPPSVLIAKTGDLVGDDIPDRYVPFGLGGDH